MERLLQWVFLGALALVGVSCWNQDAFPDQLSTLAPLANPPRQTATEEDAFTVSLKGVDYQIEPLYDYELYGVVVSFQHHNGERMLHEDWNDHLNVADLCVVWGANTQALDLNAFKFWNGQFTCFFRTRDQAAWRQFDPTALSNNHLLADDAYLRRRIENVRVGDQSRLRGQLASYSHAGGFQRGTSTSRTDTGNGACETIYVNDFAILSSMDNPWRGALTFGWVTLGLSAGIWLFGIAGGSLRHRAQ